MHLRTPLCKGARYGSDKSVAAHDPHSFYPDQWTGASRCPGWHADEAAATVLAARLRAVPGGTRLEAHPAVLTNLSRLLEPDLGEVGQVPPPLLYLFGVRLVATPLGPAEWRLVCEADGIVVDAEPAGQKEG